MALSSNVLLIMNKEKVSYIDAIIIIKANVYIIINIPCIHNINCLYGNSCKNKEKKLTSLRNITMFLIGTV